MKNLYVLDAVNLLFRSYYAIRPMTNLKGESTNALYGFIRSVFKIIKERSPEALIAVFDGPGNAETRKAIYSDYKIHREGMPADLYSQLELAILFCEYAGIASLCIPNVEADDVMGSIAKWASKKNITTYLCTSDKDLCQLVNEHVFVLNIHKEMLQLDREGVKQTYGVYPEQMVDLLALIGDTSDNIPGVRGIGEKTATALLETFGNLDHLLASTESVSEKKRALLEEGRENALLSRTLARIHTEVDIPTTLDFYRLKNPDFDKLKTLYQEMHFLSLLKELHLPQVTTKLSTKEQYVLINDEKSLQKLIELLLKEKELCIDTETSGLDPMRAELIGIGLGIRPGEAWYIPFNGQITPKEFLLPLFAKCAFFGHNIKYDLHVLKRAGFDLKTISFDTMLASYVLGPQKQRHGLDALALEYFGKVKIPITDLIGKGKNQLSMKEVPLEQVATYCCEDVDYTIRLKGLFEQLLKNEQLQQLFDEVELPLLPVLFAMEERGIFLDLEKMMEMSEQLSERLNRLTNEIYRLANQPFNLNSPKQLSKVLFDDLKIPPIQRTATGFSTSADVLEELKEESPIIEKILTYRTLEKLRSTYVDVLPSQINPETGRIHCVFNQSVTATGRLSSQDPNLQNIPLHSPEGRKIRSAFRPQLQGFSFLSADYSQIELRLLAHFSEDPELIRTFEADEDIHAHTAALVFGVSSDGVTPEMRQAAKAVNFGILYGQQAFGLSKGLNIPFAEAKTFIDTYFQRYPRIKEYLEFSKQQARKTGKATTITGRQRPIPEIHSKNPMLRQAAERLAINTPLQGTAADLIKLAMIAIHKKNLYMLLQIHDELLFEVPNSHIEEVGHFVKKSMQTVWKLKVPLIVSISIGKNWGEC